MLVFFRLLLALKLASALGFLICATLQFMDPYQVIFSLFGCLAPFAVGCLLGAISGLLSLVELETIHKRHKHPEFGIFKRSTGYGTWN